MFTDGRAAAGDGGVGPRVSVIIPARNEAANLPFVLGGLPDDVYEVLLVDGGSTDGTVAVARACRPDIRVLRQTGVGKGDALVCGFAAASGDIVVMLDADGSARGSEIPRFVKALRDGADMAKGSRFLPGGGSSDITPVRRMGNAFLATTVNVLFGSRYSDLCYGYNAIWRRCLPGLRLDCSGFEIEALLTVRAARARLAIEEIPSFEYPRIYGTSNLRPFRDGFRILKLIVRERLRPRADAAVEPVVEPEHPLPEPCAD